MNRTKMMYNVTEYFLNETNKFKYQRNFVIPILPNMIIKLVNGKLTNFDICAFYVSMTTSSNDDLYQVRNCFNIYRKIVIFYDLEL